MQLEDNTQGPFCQVSNSGRWYSILFFLEEASTPCDACIRLSCVATLLIMLYRSAKDEA
jgi:hypothetical protein